MFCPATLLLMPVPWGHSSGRPCLPHTHRSPHQHFKQHEQRESTPKMNFLGRAVVPRPHPRGAEAARGQMWLQTGPRGVQSEGPPGDGLSQRGPGVRQP